MSVGVKDNQGRKRSEGGPARLDTTLVKGLAVLTEVIDASGSVGVSALSENLKLGKSNVHRLLNTLVELGYVQQEAGTRQYKATLKIWELGSRVGDQSLLKRVSQAIVPALSKEVGETAYLSILSGVEVLYLDLVLGENGASSRPRPGLRVPAVLPASGKLLLAYQDSQRDLIDRTVANFPELKSVNRERLLEELLEIRSRGYAITISGYTEGVSSIAVPVFVDQPTPVAALGLGVFSSQYTIKKLERLLPTLNRYALRAAQTLGPT